MTDDRRPIFASRDRDKFILLSDLSDLRVDRQTGKPAVYQQVTLLWAISRATVAGPPRLQPHSACREELLELLGLFATAASRAEPRFPWYALRNTTWWELSFPPGAHLNGRGRDLVRRYDPLGGLSQTAYDLVREDDAFTGAAVRKLESYLRSWQKRDVLMRKLGWHPCP